MQADRESERNRLVATGVTAELGSNGRSNNFTSDFDNVSPYADENGYPLPSSPSPMHTGTAQATHNRPPSGSSVHHNAPSGSAPNAAAADLAGFSIDMLALPAGPIGVEHVNWLLSACGITQERAIDSLRQCSSSLFALLFQRIFNCTIRNLELEPNTQEKRLWNIERVLDELQTFVNTDLSHISAERIVALDENHISELIRVFFEIVVGFVAASTQQQQRERESARRNSGPHRPEGAEVEDAGYGPTLSGHLLPDDDASQADSAHKTQRLVSNWKREVVHPLRDLEGGLGLGGSAYSASTGTNQADVGGFGGTVTTPVKGHRHLRAGSLGLPPRGRSAGSIGAEGKAKGKGDAHHGSRDGMSELGDLRGRLHTLDQMLMPSATRKGTASNSQVKTILKKPTATHIVPTIEDADSEMIRGEGAVMRKKTKKAAARSSSSPATPASPSNDAAVSHGFLTSRAVMQQRTKKASPAVQAGGDVSHRSRGTSSSTKGVLTTTLLHRDPYVLADSATFPPSTYSLAKTIDTEARDIKIQQLKTMRFMGDVQQRMRATIVNKASEEQNEIASTVKAQQARVRADTRDMVKYARDENEKYKKAYEAILMSARNDVARCRDLIDPRTVQIYNRNAKATRAASVGVKAAIKLQREVEDRRVERYYTAVTSWRRGTVACV